MYLEHYGFSEKPFTLTPNPRFIYLSKHHREVFAHLLYGVRQRAGFIELTGEVGTGKTTVLRTLLGQLEQEPYSLAFIFNPSLSAPELLSSINQEFGIAHTGSTAELLAGLNTFLLQENAAGRTVVLVIDEAQNLAPEVLEQIRLLSNLETDTDKLIQIILVGQPELGKVLSQPGLRQLSQRITVRYHLQPMDSEDTQAYIDHRLWMAGAKGTVFTPAAVRRIYSWTQGLPRLINVLCDRALLVGYSEGIREITPSEVRTAIGELRREARPRRRWLRALPAAALSLALGGAAWILLPSSSGPAPAIPAAGPVAAAEANAGPAPRGVLPSGIVAPLAALGKGENAALGFNALAALWEVHPIRSGGTLAVPWELAASAGRRGLEVMPFSGSFDALLALDQPALLEVTVPAEGQTRYLALTAVRDGRALVTPAVGGPGGIPLSDLRRLWSGQAYLLWRNYHGLPAVTPPARGKEVALLQQLLKDAGSYGGEANGVFDEATVAAVRRYQQRRGLDPSGRADLQTLMLLYQDSARFVAPRLGGRAAGGRS